MDASVSGRRREFVLLALGSLVFVPCCSSVERTIYDSAEEVDVTPVECGDGVVNPGEECDDGNRLNGDACDWQCRTGAGEAPPLPSEEVTPFEPGPGADVGLPGDLGRGLLPLVWNGVDLSTVYHASVFAESEPHDSPDYMFFRRFDPVGDLIDQGWQYNHDGESSEVYDGHDLVWNGDGFGLFYAVNLPDSRAGGIYYLSLDANGKPRGSQVLVVADNRATMPSVAWSGESYVLSWVRRADVPRHPSCASPDVATEDREGWMRVVGLHGETEEMPGPVLYEEHLAWGVHPRLSASERGIGVAHAVDRGMPGCAGSFTFCDFDLTRCTPSSIIDDVVLADVEGSRTAFVAAWFRAESRLRDGTPDGLDVCIAQLDAEGDLADFPVCNAAPCSTCTPDSDLYNFALARSDDRVSVIFQMVSVVDERGSAYGLLSLTADLRGVAVAPPSVLVQSDDPCAFGTTFVDERLALVRQCGGRAEPGSGLVLQLFSTE